MSSVTQTPPVNTPPPPANLTAAAAACPHGLDVVELVQRADRSMKA